MTTNTNAALPDAVRVPLDSLHADAEYLCARLLDKSLTREEVVTAIRFRIDAAKAALTTAAAVPAAGWVMVPVEPTEEMIDAGRQKLGALYGHEGAKRCWHAQLAAAPKAEPVPAAPRTALWSDAQEIYDEMTARMPSWDGRGSSRVGAVALALTVVADRAMRAQAATAAVAHIQQPFTLAEIKAKIASNDYSAELLLQHAMLLLEKPDAVAGPREAVAYLDIGGGGYLDLGSDLSDEALRKLPKGRNMLAIVGTYGVDGYVPVATPTSAMWKAWQAARAQPTPPAADQEPFGYFRAEPFGWTDCAETDEGAVALYEHPTPPAVVEPPELSPDFTDTARAALLWVLWHHQGGSSPVGQPIRFALGMGQHDRLNEHQLAEAKRWERLHPVNPSVFRRGPELLTDGQIDAIWREKPRYHAAPIGVTDIEFARDIEAAAHGIKKENGNG